MFLNQRAKGRLIVGLMSGTSHDGVDAVLVKVTGRGVEARVKLISHISSSYASLLRKRIARAFTGKAQEICSLNFHLGKVFARSALECVQAAGVDIKDVSAIASHGQTICHIPPAGKKMGSTLQIGEPAVIARLTGVPVVSDFRAADMAAGGEGAPLVPYADYVLFKDRATCAVHNIGGISNATLVTPELDGVIAFDTGPANSLMDAAACMLFYKSFDRGGRVARKGSPDTEMLNKLLAHPYFRRPPPKSTGRELFGGEMVEGLIREYPLRAEDLMSTLAHFTALSIKGAYERFILPGHSLREVIFSGGGTKNTFLMGLIRECLHPLPVRLMDEYGIPSSAKEAISFAILANETLSGGPSNLPAVTGAVEAVRLGKLTFP